ncbi:F390 synthetase-related protein [Streptococcus infantis]|uniref:F390 synthetase-related protein n=1 Tax=Streptococcus infantis TaxID=68892 RepID=UPI001BD9B0C1|nr:F390 synthetase-related protein [Streptococcus infantis]MBT0952008.1 CoF synthetase [Streptococcus infantis]
MKKITFLKTFIQTRWLHNFKSRKALESYQKKQLDVYMEFLKHESPYFKNGVPSDFDHMDKAFMMTHFNELNTQGVDRDEALALAIESEKTRNFTELKGEIAVGLSSGTSGHRGLFITTEKERSMWAAAILAKMLPKGHLFGHRIAFFLRADNELYQTINTALIRLEYFDIFKNTDEHIERLNNYQPTIVVAPASMLIELSKRLKAGELKIHPQKVVSVAEILEDSDRERISEAFALPVIDQVYQATEGFLACTCSAGNLHLNEDIIFVEKHYLDDRRFYPVITDFKRSSQPVYRYKLNDILVENPEPCSCGSHYTRIDKVEGRSDDIFYFEDQDGGQVTIYPDFIRRCILFVENVGDYQVKQHSEKLVEVCLSRRDEQLETAITEQFRLLAQQKEFKAPEIQFSDYQWDTSRKLKRIQRL